MSIESPAGLSGLGLVLGSFESSVSSSELSSSVGSEPVPDGGTFFPEDALARVLSVVLGDEPFAAVGEITAGVDGGEILDAVGGTAGGVGEDEGVANSGDVEGEMDAGKGVGVLWMGRFFLFSKCLTGC